MQIQYRDTTMVRANANLDKDRPWTALFFLLATTPVLPISGLPYSRLTFGKCCCFKFVYTQLLHILCMTITFIFGILILYPFSRDWTRVNKNLWNSVCSEIIYPKCLRIFDIICSHPLQHHNSLQKGFAEYTSILPYILLSVKQYMTTSCNLFSNDFNENARISDDYAFR